MESLPLILIVALIAVVMFMSTRNRKRAAVAEADRRDRLQVGTEVMTTAGLYGTITELNDDGTVLLSIAPGVEVRWQIAALRDAASLPSQLRGALADADENADTESDQAGQRDEPQSPRRDRRSDGEES